MSNLTMLLSFLLTATNASACINLTLGHAKFTTLVREGGQEAKRIGCERGAGGRREKSRKRGF